MCDYCFNNTYPSFPTDKDFEEFKLLLNEKLQQQNGLKYSGDKEKPDTEGINVYQCENCKTTWWLSKPEEGGRGFFIRDSDFLTYLKNRTRSNKIYSYGCIIYFILLVILIIVLSIYFPR